MAIMLPQIQPIGLSPVPYQRLDYSPLFQGPGIMGGLRQGLQQGRQNAALKQQMEMRQQQMEQQAEENRIKGIVTTAAEIQGLPAQEQQRRLQARALELQEKGMNYDTELEALEMLHNDPAAFNETLNGTIEYGQRMGILKPTTAELMAAKRATGTTSLGAQKTFRDEEGNYFFGSMKKTGDQVETVLTPVTAGTEPVGKLEFVSDMGQTASEKSRMAIEQAQQIAQLKATVEENSAAAKEYQKQLGQYRATINEEETKNFGLAQSSARTLTELENALEAADTGKWAQAKTFIGKYVPGVDIKDEQALDAILTQLAIQELMKFSGPTTDFEFLKSMNTLVQTGNTKEANRLILDRMKRDVGNALDRHKAFAEYKGQTKEWENFESDYARQQEAADKMKPDGASVRAGGLYKEGDINRYGDMMVKNGWWTPIDKALAPPQGMDPNLWNQLSIEDKKAFLADEPPPKPAGVPQELWDTMTRDEKMEFK